MADYLTGDQGAVTTLSGTGAPTTTNICRWGMRVEKPRRNTTPFGSTYTRYKMTRVTATGFFDVMILDSDSALPAIPNNAQLSAVFRTSTTGTATNDTGYSMTIRVESQQITVDNISAETQIIRYTWWLDSAISVD